MNEPIRLALQRLGNGQSLSFLETEHAVAAVLHGLATDVETAALLTALKVQGETAEELAGAVSAVRSQAADHGIVFPTSGVLDTCGTGGDGANTVNISTAAALVAAACGQMVVKHGNRSASGNSGSSEVLTELGVRTEPSPEAHARCLKELGITFLFAPFFHPGMRHVGPIRRALPFRTLFNLVGPLANPSRPDYQLIGVAGEPQAALVAGALAKLGIKRAAVVTGADGLDEVSLHGPSRVLVVEGGEVRSTTWEPDDFGLSRVHPASIVVNGPRESAALISGFLEGEIGPVRDMILANAAAALWVVEDCDWKAAVGRAADAVDSGRALRLLERWRVLSYDNIEA